MALCSCGGTGDTENQENNTVQEEVMKFEKIAPENSGIHFKNEIKETEEVNFFKFEYIYNGGGVAVGDINNDGLMDLYFTGNQVSDKLYLNKGEMQFEDITEKSIGPLASAGWHTGVLMVDVNNDGWLDIYVNRAGETISPDALENLLFINNGDLTFSEKGAEYGVNIGSNSTQSIFFDMDNDNDLDLYVMNNPNNAKNEGKGYTSVGEINDLIRRGSPYSDRLLRNDGGKFVDVTKEAGISNHAFGLGIAASDLNNDGWLDLYVSNDYMAPDYMYINNGDGTFSEEIKQRTGHISNFSMGNDVADFNNDGLVDVITVDMVSEDHIRSKKNMGGMSTKKFWDVVNVGYHYQYMFNALQLNNGDGSFSDVAQLAGVSKTDWSWAPLFADFDNDGKKDLFITNGYKRDTRDNDYNNSVNIEEAENSFQEALDLMPSTKISNYMFQNNGDLTFSSVAKKWKMDAPVNSNGAAYADLDNDGDLDLIVNNIDEVSYVLENKLSSNNNYLRFQFKDESIGVKIKIELNDEVLYHEFQPVRGFQSSVEHLVHVGLGTQTEVKNIELFWLDGSYLKLDNTPVNQIVSIDKKEATKNTPAKNENTTYLAENAVLNYVHQEKFVNDFEVEVLLPNKMSQLGPFVSKGDVDGNGLEDIYVSGSLGYTGSLFLQMSENNFQLKSGPWSSESAKEELGSVMFDADQDGDLDLYVTSGSNEYRFDSPMMMDQLYINDGKGNFKNETNERLPQMLTSGQSVATGDFDGDGDLDLFVGGRQTPGYYPFAPRSYLLKNEGGVFVEVTMQSPDLMGPGMITESIFSDYDRDGDLDLICVGEWMPISFFQNNDGVFINQTPTTSTANDVGWWYSINEGDFNNDGAPDYLVGNVGSNNKFHPAADHPLEIYCRDFDKNGTYDIVLAKYQNDVCYPVRGKQCSSEQMPNISEKFPTYNEYATATLEKIYGKEELDSALHYSASEFRSVVLLSNGNGGFTKSVLSNYAQMGPINCSVILDINGDGNQDIIAAGNNFAAEVETVRYDGGRGIVLLGDGKGGFDPLMPWESGLLLTSDVKDVTLIGKNLLFFSNASPVKSFILK